MPRPRAPANRSDILVPCYLEVACLLRSVIDKSGLYLIEAIEKTMRIHGAALGLDVRDSVFSAECVNGLIIMFKLHLAGGALAICCSAQEESKSKKKNNKNERNFIRTPVWCENMLLQGDNFVLVQLFIQSNMFKFLGKGSILFRPESSNDISFRLLWMQMASSLT